MGDGDGADRIGREEYIFIIYSSQFWCAVYPVGDLVIILSCIVSFNGLEMKI